jgi:hypothetical protein
LSDCQNWIAWIDHRPRPTPVVRVQGDCVLPAGSTVLLRRPLSSDAAPTPSIQGPLFVTRGGPPPAFNVNAGPGRFYSLEVSADPALFRGRNASTRFPPSVFYDTWQDGTLLSGDQASLPGNVWASLQAADFLFYRIVTSSRQDVWENPASSDAGAAPGQGPMLAIVDSDDGLDDPGRLILVRIVSLPPGGEVGDAAFQRAAYAEATKIAYRSATVLPDGVTVDVDDVY